MTKKQNEPRAEVSVVLPEGVEEEFKALDELARLLSLVESRNAPDSLRQLRALEPNAPWETLTPDTAMQFAATLANKPLAQAVEAFADLSRARAKNAALAAGYDQAAANRKRRLLTALATAPTAEAVNDALGFLPESVQIEFTAAAGLALSCGLSDDRTNSAGDASELKLTTPAASFKFEHVRAVLDKAGDGSLVRLPALTASASVVGGAPSERVILLVAPKVQLHWQKEEMPRGGHQWRRTSFQWGDALVTVRLDDDRALLIDDSRLKTFELLGPSVQLVSVLVQGAVGAVDVDALQFALFAATGAEFALLEEQEIECDAVVGITTRRVRLGELNFHSALGGNGTEERLASIAAMVSRLPDDGETMSKYHFRVLCHGILGALRRPIQQSFTDLYVVLDTLGGLHPDVPRTKYDTITFNAVRATQRRIVKLGALLVSLFGLTKTKTKDDARELLVGAVDGLRNDLGVIRRVLALLKACGIDYDKKVKAQKLALDLRHRLTHDLASVRISDDEYSVRELEGARIVLLQWCRDALISVMRRTTEDLERSEANTLPERSGR